MRVILALAIGASAFENSYLSQMSQRAVKANTATMDNARVAKDSASYLESLPQASTPTVEAKVAAPSTSSRYRPRSRRRRAGGRQARPTPAELAAAAAPVKLASGAEADFAAQCVATRAPPLFLASDFARSSPTDLICAQRARRTFPIKPEVVARAKEVFPLGIGTKDEGACLAEGFEFCAPVVGPLPKEEYLKALASFKLEETFDLNAQYHLFRVDPTQTNRVWFHTRTLGKHVNDSPRFGPATGKEIINPPQCMHLDFTADGLVKEFGFYTVDRRQGNTGGLGGAFAFFYGVGRALPIPEMQPYKPSKRASPVPAHRQAPEQVCQEGRGEFRPIHVQIHSCKAHTGRLIHRAGPAHESLVRPAPPRRRVVRQHALAPLGERVFIPELLVAHADARERAEVVDLRREDLLAELDRRAYSPLRYSTVASRFSASGQSGCSSISFRASAAAPRPTARPRPRR